MLGSSYTIVDIKDKHKEIISEYFKDWESYPQEDELQSRTIFLAGRGYGAAMATLVLDKKTDTANRNYITFVGANSRTNGEGLLKKINE